MITHHFLQLLQDNGLGTLDVNLFYGQAPLNKNGVTAIERGGSGQRARARAVQVIDLYSRHEHALQGADKLEKIREFMVANPDPCDLPTTEKSNKVYERVSLVPSGNIENIGLDETDRMLFRLTIELIYTKE